MKILVVDTETTGLPRNTSIYETNNWPYIVQLSYILFDINNYIIKKFVIILLKFQIMFLCQNLLSIFTKSRMRFRNKGKNVKIVLNKFKKCCLRADCIVAHNIIFDKM